MKTKKIMKAAFAVMLMCFMAVVMTACAKDVTVNVKDSGTNTEIETQTGKKISEVLDEAKITVGDKDTTEPALDSELSEDTAEILIKRYAKVTVVSGSEEKEVELVGGTVEDAVKAAGFDLSDGAKTDAELSAYLKNGMTINVLKELKVSITADGETKEVSTKASTVKELLDEQGIKLGSDDEISEKPETELKDAMKITIKRVEYKEETEKETVAYSTEEQYSDSMDKGESEVTQEGSDGEKEITYKVKYVDGKEDSREKVSENVTKEPVNEIVTYGTKEEESSTAPAEPSEEVPAEPSEEPAAPVESSEEAQGGRTITSKVPVYDCDGSGHGYYEIYYSDGTVEYEEF